MLQYILCLKVKGKEGPLKDQSDLLMKQIKQQLLITSNNAL